MAEGAQEPEPQQLIARRKPLQEKGIGKPGQRQQLQPLLPAPQTRTLESQLALVKAPTQFDLPPAQISEDHAPGIFIGRDRLSRQQIPGGASEARGRPPATGACPDSRGASP